MATRSTRKAAPEQQREPEPPAASEPEPPAAPEQQREPEPPVHRAGGWIDRGDGRGWELED